MNLFTFLKGKENKKTLILIRYHQIKQVVEIKTPLMMTNLIHYESSESSESSETLSESSDSVSDDESPKSS